MPAPATRLGASLVQDVNNLGQMIDLRELVGALYRHKWGIFSITLVVVILAGLWVFATTPIYQATATLLIENHSNRPVKQVQDVYDPGYGTDAYVKTQYKILNARELGRKVVKKLGLEDKPEFSLDNSGLLPADWNWQQWLPFLPDHIVHPQQPIDLATQKLEHAVDVFEKHLNVEPVADTDLVKINYESKDAALAAQVANALTDVFIESNLDARLAMSNKTTSWLNERLGSIRDDLKTAQAALQAFRDKEHLVDVGGTRGLVETQLTDSLTQLRTAQQKKTDLASAYWKIQQAGNNYAQLENVSTLLTSPVVQDAKNRMLEAQQKLKTLASRYGPRHPLMQAAQATVNSATTAYHTQLMIAAQGVKAEYEVAAQTAQQVGTQEQQARSQIVDLDRKQTQLDTLQRDVTTNQQLYDLFLTRFKETESSGDYQEVVARVIDPAVVPDTPAKPKKKKILLVALAIGFILGLVAALLRHMLSDAISSSEDMEVLTGLQVLAALPEFKKGKKASLQMISEPKGGFSEGMRSVRTGLLLADLSRKAHKIVITSSVPQEGKTTISCNLAITLGQMERVLLVDCDLRRATVAKTLGLPDKSPGLTEYLAGSATLDQCVFRHEEGKIDVLPVGQIPPNPGEILALPQFHQMIDALATRYDRIIFDSAPCQAVSDTLLLVQNADAVLFVVKADATARSLVRNTVRQLKFAHAPIIGAVINAVDMTHYSKRYGGHYYDYRYYA
ncbi:MAG: GumC family protein [Stenotrophobium sp.]